VTESDKKKTGWPRYLPYTPVAMGMIQPEWVFMSHFFDDEEEDHEPDSPSNTEPPPDGEAGVASVPAHPRREPLVRIRARKSRSSTENSCFSSRE
jgi:hypothetical protein